MPSRSSRSATAWVTWPTFDEPEQAKIRVEPPVPQQHSSVPLTASPSLPRS